MDKVQIELKDGAQGFKVVGNIVRAIIYHVGWQSIRYHGERYQLFGMIRNPYFINIDHPLKGKGKK